MVGDGMDQEPIGVGDLHQILCSCWVKDRPDEERFSLRYGAHNPGCPMFRPSYDPLANLRDAQLRMQHERD